MQAAGGRFVHIPTGNARPQQAASAGFSGHWDGPEVLSAPGTSAPAEVIPTAECPVVAYRQGAADLCAAYGLASAVHEYGDASGAAAIAACARAALASGDAFGHMTNAVRTHARLRQARAARLEMGARAPRHPLAHQPSPRGPARCVQCADGGDLLLVFFSIYVFSIYVFSIFSSTSSRNDRMRSRAVCGRADARAAAQRACS